MCLKKRYFPLWFRRLRKRLRDALQFPAGPATRVCVLTHVVSRADVQRGPGGVRVAQSEPAAALEEARRRRRRLRRADRRGEAAASGPEGLGSSRSGGGKTSPPRRRRAEAAGERVREPASRVGEGRRPRREAKARGERPRPPSSSARTRARRPSLARTPSPPFPLPAVPVARGLRPARPSPMTTALAVAYTGVRERPWRAGSAPPRLHSSPSHVRPRWPSRSCRFRPLSGGEGAAAGEVLPDPCPRLPISCSRASLQRWAARARGLPDCGTPRSPLPHSARPKIGPRRCGEGLELCGPGLNGLNCAIKPLSC